MSDEHHNQHSTSNTSKPPGAIPAPRPVYSTSDYADKRKTPPPPPPVQSTAARDRIRRRRVSGRSNSAGDWAWVVVAGALFGVILVISAAAFIFVNSSNISRDVIPTADVSDHLPTPVVAYSEFGEYLGEDALILADGSTIQLVPWDGESRFTMVLVGLDRRPEETGLMYRTDTMMLISLDPATNSIGVLSIPRDMFVQIPGYSQRQRINSAMFLGELQQRNYGPTLMMQTIMLNLGIRVHDFMAVDFQAFIDVIDAIGGINVETDYVINDPEYPDMNYGYDPFYLPAGKHHLDGYNALRFARTRHGNSDIDRASRQQQVIYAIRDAANDLERLPTFILQAPALWNSWEDNVYTGLTFEQIIQLGLFAKDVPRENISMGVINYYYLQDYELPNKQQVLIPIQGRLASLMTEVFGPNYSQ